MIINKIHKLKNKKAQAVVEYVILFAVVIAVIVFACIYGIGPALNGVYDRTAQSLDDIDMTAIP